MTDPSSPARREARTPHEIAAYAAIVPFVLAIAALLVIIFTGAEVGKNAIVAIMVCGTVLGVITALIVNAILKVRR